MGTSSARHGPTTPLWRVAKGMATRYLSPEGQGAVEAREVVARYLTALTETSGQGNQLAAWRVTRKAAQELGALAHEVQVRGWEAALAERGLVPPAPGDAAMLAQEVSGDLAGSGGGLEEAMVRTSLALVLLQAAASGGTPEPAQLVREFLATSLYLRLALDLGEPLEAAAGGYRRLREGLTRIKATIETGMAATSPPGEPPGTPVQWQGLPGWTWVTEIMAALLAKLQ
jgi:hypothetical protein